MANTLIHASTKATAWARRIVVLPAGKAGAVANVNAPQPPGMQQAMPPGRQPGSLKSHRPCCLPHLRGIRRAPEQEIQNYVAEQLKEEKLDNSISLNVVQITNVQPNAEILKSATDYVRSQNELKIKENEVKLAKLESERMSALAANSTQSIAYMQAQAALNISEGIKQGKVNTIVVPSNITMLGSVGK